MTTVLLPFSQAHAIDNETNSSAVTAFPDQRTPTPFANVDRNRRLGLLTDYIRKEGPGWVPGLPSSLSNPSNWIQNQLGFHSFMDGEDENPSNFQALSSLMQPPAPETAEAMWFSPGYHHKGFIPLHDAMMMGVNLRHRMLDERLQFDVHPFYGQNWHDISGYYGTEVGVGLRAASTGNVWGKISLRYNNGESALMDSGRGFDMHSELHFDNHLSLNAGIRENTDSQLGNYVVLRWKLVSGP